MAAINPIQISTQYIMLYDQPSILALTFSCNNGHSLQFLHRSETLFCQASLSIPFPRSSIAMQLLSSFREEDHHFRLDDLNFRVKLQNHAVLFSSIIGVEYSSVRQTWYVMLWHRSYEIAIRHNILNIINPPILGFITTLIKSMATTLHKSRFSIEKTAISMQRRKRKRREREKDSTEIRCSQLSS